MDIPQRTMNAVGKRDESVKRWMTTSMNQLSCKKNESDFKITFNNGSMLLSAVSLDDIEEVERLIKEGADVNFANADGLTSLHQACIDECLPLVKKLVENGANVNSRDNEGWTPLHAAASTTSLEIVKYLVEHGAFLSAVNTDGELPVDLVEEDDIRDYLLEKLNAKKINLKNARNLEHDRMLKDVELWVSQGKITEVCDPQGATALHVAASKNYMDIIQILVEKLKMDINVKDNDGWTPLHAAVYWKQMDVISYLLDNKADYQAKTTVGLIPLDLADDDIVLKYKNLIRRKFPNNSLINKKDKNELVDVTQSIKFPHTYKSPLPSILKSNSINKVAEELMLKSNVVQNQPRIPVPKPVYPPQSLNSSQLPNCPLKTAKIGNQDENSNSDLGSYEYSMELKKPPIRPPTSSNLITNKMNSNNTDTLINKNKLDDELLKQTLTKTNNDSAISPNKTVTKNISARPNSAILSMTQSKPNLPPIKSNIGIAKPNLPPSKLTGNKSNLSDSNSSISTSSQSKTSISKPTNSKPISKFSGIHPPKRVNKTDNTSILSNKHSKITNIATTKLSRSGSGVETGTRSGIYPPKRTSPKSSQASINTQNLKSTKIFSGSGNVIHPPSDLLVTVTTKDKTTNVLTNNKTDCVIRPQTNISQNSRLQEQKIKNNNNLQNQTMSLTEALAEIEKLKEQLEIKKLENESLESKLKDLKINDSNNKDNSDYEKLLKENKRLQQENATLIRAISTHMKSKKESTS